MTKEEMKAYADKLNPNPASANMPVSNPVTARNGYKGYIPSAAAAPIKPQAQQAPAQVAPAQPKDDMTPEMKALLERADRVIANGSRYLDK